MDIPGYWGDEGQSSFNGVVWFRKSINIPKEMVGKPAMIWLGRIVDADSVFINEKFIGTTTYLYPRRRYEFPTGILKEGKNRQVRKMTAAVGFPTLRLIRYRIEKITLDNLLPGKMKIISKQELYNLLKIKKENKDDKINDRIWKSRTGSR